MRALATDHEIWRAKYIETFSRQRLRRAAAVPGMRDASIDWKGRFKTKTNWSNGKARLHELEVASPPTPPVVAQVHNGIVFVVDTAGLRAWSTEHRNRALRAQISLDSVFEATCIAVQTVDGETNILLGFKSGRSSLYIYQEPGQLKLRSSHHSEDGPLMAVSLTFPYMMTVSTTKFLSIYQLKSAETQAANTASISTITRLQSDASFSPISGSLRRTPSGIIATVAYAFNRLQSGWCIGLQEIRLTASGRLLQSRTTSTLETPIDLDGLPRVRWNMTTRSTSSTTLPLHPQMMSPPTSLSYEHPFLIGTLQDNTMMMFLVTSNDNQLEISSGRRLWGHTSAVSGAEVNNRGKAVSISSRGDEVRVWELETVMTGTPSRTSTPIKAVDALSGVAEALARRGSGLGLALKEVKRELHLDRRWVGFDDEQVAILGETADHRQIMALYDFT